MLHLVWSASYKFSRAAGELKSLMIFENWPCETSISPRPSIVCRRATFSTKKIRQTNAVQASEPLQVSTQFGQGNDNKTTKSLDTQSTLHLLFLIICIVLGKKLI